MFALAQSAPSVGIFSTWLVVLLLVGGAVFVFALVLTAVLVRFYRADRELSHAERIKAIEAGFSPNSAALDNSQSKFMHNAFWIAFWIGFGVPAAAFSSAASATQKLSLNTGLGVVIWVGAGIAAVAAVVSATVLMISTRVRMSDASPERPIKGGPI